MATYPYVTTTGSLHAFLTKLRHRFPSKVTADTLRKLALAPKNESVVINTIKLLGFIDDEGKKVDAATKHFVGDDKTYQEGMKRAVKKCYSDLFEMHGDKAWTLDKELLTTFFRMSDDTSEIVGQRQANTFLALAAEAGIGEIPKKRNGKGKNSSTSPKKKRATKPKTTANGNGPTTVGSYNSAANGMDLAFALRIELNLPATDDRKVFDSIFKSIRENLIEPYQA